MILLKASSAVIMLSDGRTCKSTETFCEVSRLHQQYLWDYFESLPMNDLPKQRPSTIFVTGMGLFLLALIVAFVLLTRVEGFIGTDDYYHSRIAAQIIEQGRLHLDFPWLPMSILSNEQFVDHH